MVTERAADAGFTVWLTGLSGSGKSTIATALAARIAERGHRVEVLDGDEVRTNLSAGLSFSKEDRDANVRRIGWVCELLSRNGVVAIAAAISPYRAARDEVRARIGRFVEIHVDASLDALEARDSKGLYRRAREGALTGLTGVDDPYEPPEHPELTIRTDGTEGPDASVDRIVSTLEGLGYLAPAEPSPAEPSSGQPDAAYTEDEESEVTDRLRDLGYL
jgi:adenylyl-sulfate kinase